MTKEQEEMVKLIAREAVKEMRGEVLTQEQLNEKWLTADELAEFFHWKPGWIDRNGKYLDRQKPDGGCFLYPLHHIQKMMWNGEIKNLSTK